MTPDEIEDSAVEAGLATMELQTLTLTQKPKRVMTMNRDVQNYMSRVIDHASSMTDYFIINMPPESLYTMLCGGDFNVLNDFARAARHMAPDNYHDVVTVPVLMKDHKQIEDISFVVSMENTQRYHRYLMPKHIAVITPESKWYSTIEPGIKLAQEWEITKDLFNQFAYALTTDQIGAVLPWLKELARDAVQALEGENAWRFISQQGLSQVANNAKRKQTLIQAFKRLAHPLRASRTPALSSRINQATRLGDKLFGQHRMLSSKDTPARSNSYFAVHPSTKLLPDWYKTDMQMIMAQWKGEANIFDDIPSAFDDPEEGDF